MTCRQRRKLRQTNGLIACEGFDDRATALKNGFSHGSISSHLVHFQMDETGTGQMSGEKKTETGLDE